MTRFIGRAGQTLATRLPGALLCLAVAWIHVQDQGGFPGSKTPTYVADGYYVLEVVGVLTAVLLIADIARAGWFLAMGVAAGPLVGFILSRGPGLPDYSDDKGNWTETLGLVSLAVEAALLVLSVTLFLRNAGSSEPAQVAASVDDSDQILASQHQPADQR